MPRGGKREGAGRPKGARNKRTVAMVEAAQRLGMLPHEFLAAIARGEGFEAAALDEDGNVIPGTQHTVYPTLEQRISCASAAAPYYASRLAAIEHSGAITVTKDASEYSDDELASMLAEYEREEKAAKAKLAAGDAEPAKSPYQLSRMARNKRS